jgi:glutamate-1-semialdehyde aminotransferase
VKGAIDAGWSLTGSGTTPWEGRAAELLAACVPNLERVQFTTTGSEATLSRAATFARFHRTQARCVDAGRLQRLAR